MVVWKVLSCEKLKRQRYHQYSSMLACWDIVQCGSWLIGPKYDNPYTVCSIQEYMYQVGGMYKSITIVVISVSIFYIILTSKTPAPNIIKRGIALAFAVGTMCLLASMSIHTAHIFCDIESRESADFIDNSKAVHTQRLAYVFTFVLPIYVCFMLNLICTVYTAVLLSFKSSNTLLPLLRPLLPYPVILSIALIPSGTYFFTVLSTGNASAVHGHMSALGISCSGIFFNLAYIYYSIVDNERAVQVENVPWLRRHSSTNGDPILSSDISENSNPMLNSLLIKTAFGLTSPASSVSYDVNV